MYVCMYRKAWGLNFRLIRLMEALILQLLEVSIGLERKVQDACPQLNILQMVIKLLVSHQPSKISLMELHVLA